MNLEQKRKLLFELKKRMKEDNSLPLKKTSTNLVFGEGNPDSLVLFIGEGPGFWEDKKGRPFVGNAGALLNQLLSSIKLRREDVYITNVIHYRPPGNRDPLPQEIKAFEPYLDEIIKIIKPKLIVTLGRFSMAKFLPNSKISSVHGKKYFINFQGIDLIIVPMFHPAAALRSEEIKIKLFDDFKKLKKILEDLKKQNLSFGGQEKLLNF